MSSVVGMGTRTYTLRGPDVKHSRKLRRLNESNCRCCCRCADIGVERDFWRYLCDGAGRREKRSSIDLNATAGVRVRKERCGEGSIARPNFESIHRGVRRTATSGRRDTILVVDRKARLNGIAVVVVGVGCCNKFFSEKLIERVRKADSSEIFYARGRRLSFTRPTGDIGTATRFKSMNTRKINTHNI